MQVATSAQLHRLNLNQHMSSQHPYVFHGPLLILQCTGVQGIKCKIGQNNSERINEEVNPKW